MVTMIVYGVVGYSSIRITQFGSKAQAIPEAMFCRILMFTGPVVGSPLKGLLSAP